MAVTYELAVRDYIAAQWYVFFRSWRLAFEVIVLLIAVFGVYSVVGGGVSVLILYLIVATVSLPAIVVAGSYISSLRSGVTERRTVTVTPEGFSRVGESHTALYSWDKLRKAYVTNRAIVLTPKRGRAVYVIPFSAFASSKVQSEFASRLTAWQL